MEKNIKKTSYEWAKLSEYFILDPDGWDRTNFKFSFHHEKITQEEFNVRLNRSTTFKKNIK